MGKEGTEENTNYFKEPQAPNYCSQKNILLLGALKNWLNWTELNNLATFLFLALLVSWEAMEWREGDSARSHYLLSSVCQLPGNFLKQRYDFKQSKEDSVNLEHLKLTTWLGSRILKSSKAEHENSPCFRLSSSHMSCLEPFLLHWVKKLKISVFFVCTPLADEGPGLSRPVGHKRIYVVIRLPWGSLHLSQVIVKTKRSLEKL